jgi:hypothetical protein
LSTRNSGAVFIYYQLAEENVLEYEQMENKKSVLTTEFLEPFFQAFRDIACDLIVLRWREP